MSLNEIDEAPPLQLVHGCNFLLGYNKKTSWGTIRCRAYKR